jgi:phage-related protein
LRGRAVKIAVQVNEARGREGAVPRPERTLEIIENTIPVFIARGQMIGRHPKKRRATARKTGWDR